MYASWRSTSQTLSGDHAELLGKHAAVLDLRSGNIRWSFSDAEIIDAKVSLTAALAVVVPQNPRQRRRRFNRVAAPQPTGDEFAPTSWTTSFITRARQPWASVVACGDDLLIGDWSSSAVIPLALPLRCTSIPIGTVLGTYGRRVLLLNSAMAQVCSLDDGMLIAEIPLDALQRKAEEGLIHQNSSAWISGAVSGRLGWISGPGGVMTIDLDSCEMVDHQLWSPDWSVAANDVTHWALGGAMIQEQQNNNNGNASTSERLPVGVVSAGFVVLPVGSQRLVALSAPAGGSDGR